MSVILPWIGEGSSRWAARRKNYIARRRRQGRPGLCRVRRVPRVRRSLLPAVPSEPPSACMCSASASSSVAIASSSLPCKSTRFLAATSSARSLASLRAACGVAVVPQDGVRYGDASVGDCFLQHLRYLLKRYLGGEVLARFLAGHGAVAGRVGRPRAEDVTHNVRDCLGVPGAVRALAGTRSSPRWRCGFGMRW